MSNFGLFSKYNPQYAFCSSDDVANIVDVILDNIAYLDEQEATDQLKQLAKVPCISVNIDEPRTNLFVLVNSFQVVWKLEENGFIP